jgi:hypothetical protein
MKLIPVHQLPRLIEREFVTGLYQEITRQGEELADARRRLRELEAELQDVRMRAADAIGDPDADAIALMRDLISGSRRQPWEPTRNERS